MDDEFYQELMQTFIKEFEELMELYQSSLSTLQLNKETVNDDTKQAYADLFRIYHTLKGDAGYFPEFQEFADFSSRYCEILRPLDDSVYQNKEIYRDIRLNYTRLSAALQGMRKGRSLQSYRFASYGSPN